VETHRVEVHGIDAFGLHVQRLPLNRLATHTAHTFDSQLIAGGLTGIDPGRDLLEAVLASSIPGIC